MKELCAECGEIHGGGACPDTGAAAVPSLELDDPRPPRGALSINERSPSATRWTVQGQEIVADVDPMRGVAMLRIGDRAVVEMPANTPFAFVLAGGGNYRGGGQHEGQARYDAARGVFSLWIDGWEIQPAHAPPPTSRPGPAPLQVPPRQDRGPTSSWGQDQGPTSSRRQAPTSLRSGYAAPPPSAVSAEASEADARLTSAYRSLLFIAGINGLLGLVMLSPIASSIQGVAVSGLGSVIVGVLYAVLAFLTAQRSRIALGMAITLFAVDGVTMIVLGGFSAGLAGAIVVRVFLIARMVRGFGAITALNDEDGQSASTSAGLGSIALAAIGIVAILHFAARSSLDHTRHDPSAAAAIDADKAACLRRADDGANAALGRLAGVADPAERARRESSIQEQRQLVRIGCVQHADDCKRDRLSLPCLLGN